MATNLRLQSVALVALLLVSYIGAPASAQEVQEDPKQPSVDNPHMHIYGTDDLSSCFIILMVKIQQVLLKKDMERT